LASTPPLMYRRHSVKAEYHFDESWYQVHLRSDRMLKLDGATKLLDISAGENNFILGFGGGNDIFTKNGTVYLVDQW